MYGLIGKMTAVAGQREALAAILLEGTQAIPGCLSYIIATESADPDALWVTEVWDCHDSHKASLGLPGMKAAIAKGRPLTAGFSHRVETTPVGGCGLAHQGPACRAGTRSSPRRPSGSFQVFSRRRGTSPCSHSVRPPF
jgi:quinol monooxygenase YgiN